MLELKEIKKVYNMADQNVEALKGINLKFRKNEFVSILGHSGCGKTTMLNIIGGLDRYTSGDLIINGKSTKEYKDKDWDNYRNHRVGFVFQSYNLIPHQTVLENVELALTLSGVSKKERKERAIRVLEKVGLKDKLKNKPNQLSGGQMQRVAIARALVNDPEIILADEPTGALDSKTSEQVMEILKEISSDKLIIMVTHNPELAERYSTRIVKLLDGNLIGDTNPPTDEEIINEEEKYKQKVSTISSKELLKRNRKKNMSFFTALSLSFKNLLTKKGRTLLVAFAGSIGIIGIALILAISNGFSTYVNKMQEDTLSSYPITIEAKAVDFTSIMMSMFLDDGENTSVEHGNDKVYPKNSISKIMENVTDNLKPNNLTKFYRYINEHYDEISDFVSAVQCTYDLNFEFYDNNNTPIDPQSPALMNMIRKYSLFFLQKQIDVELEFLDNGSCNIIPKESTHTEFMNNYPTLNELKIALDNRITVNLTSEKVLGLVYTIMGLDSSSTSSGMVSMNSIGSGVFSEMLDNETLIRSQYDLICGDFAREKFDVMLVLDQNSELDDYVLYALGIISEQQMEESLKALVNGEQNPTSVDYTSVVGKNYKLLTESDYYIKDGEDIIDFRLYNQEKVIDPETMQSVTNVLYDPAKFIQCYKNALDNCANIINVVGILRQNQSTDSGSIQTGIVYTSNLTKYIVEDYHKNSLAVKSGKIDEIILDTPETINIYVNTFEAKSKLQKFISTYNEQAKNGDEITYTDLVGVIMSTVSTIINAITYVLIAFVSVSLIVSSIMIGIITYISVIERTKEIGVLRSVGASKRDIRRVFNAESFIIGISSGIFGILITLIFTIPINLILKYYTALVGIAKLPIMGAIILIVISILLTQIAGFIPAKIASKKDPVVALRSE